MASSVCRVCLTGNIRLLNIDNIYLQIFEKLTDSKVNRESESGMPSTVCYVCYRQLQRCHMFSEMAHRSHRTMQDLLDNGIEITCRTITMLGLAATPTLSVTCTDHLSIIQYSSTPITVKQEKDVAKKEETADNTLEESQVTWDEDTQVIGPSNNTKLYEDNVNEQTNINLHFYCDVCNKLFFSKNDLIKHLKHHMGNNPYSKQCDVTLCAQTNLAPHEEDNIMSYPCSSCKKIFSHEHFLKSHMEVHEKKQWSCSVCSVSLASKAVWIRHVMSHFGVRPYPCTICSKSYTWQSTLTRHMRTHTGEKRYSCTCTVCTKKFGDSTSLKYHMRLHTGERPYACSTCSKTFVLNASLRAHMRTHTGEKPYSCTICHTKFSENKRLKYHMRLHTGEEPYSCTICQRKFNHSTKLKYHMRLHSGEKP